MSYFGPGKLSAVDTGPHRNTYELIQPSAAGQMHTWVGGPVGFARVPITFVPAGPVETKSYDEAKIAEIQKAFDREVLGLEGSNVKTDDVLLVLFYTRKFIGFLFTDGSFS